MEQDFYKAKLIKKNLNVIIPDEKDINLVNSIIYNELCKGIVKEESKKIYLSVIDKLINCGAESVILGCTEIGLLISQKDCVVPVFDTALLHAEEAAILAVK